MLLLIECLPRWQPKTSASSKLGATGAWVQALKSAQICRPLRACFLPLKWGCQLLTLKVVAETRDHRCQALPQPGRQQIQSRRRQSDDRDREV